MTDGLRRLKWQFIIATKHLMGVEFLKVNSYLFKFLENRLEIFKIFIYKDRYAIHIADPSSIFGSSRTRVT